VVKENSTGFISTPRLGTETRAANNQTSSHYHNQSRRQSRPSKTLLHPDMIIEDLVTEEEMDANNYSSNKLIQQLQANAEAKDATDDGEIKILRKLQGGFNETMENIGKKSSVPNSQRKRKPSRYAQNMHDDVDTINYDEFDEDDNTSDDKDQLPTNLFEHENHQ
jgi:hypothetical protein